MIQVERPGILSLFQDLGRTGYRAQGVARSGAYDELAHRCANAAVGNIAEAATLEITLGGPTLRFKTDATVVMSGPLFETWINDQPAKLTKPHEIEAGSVLRIGRATQGLRAYLAVLGGFEVPTVLGSRSTHAVAKVGPPALSAGALISIGSQPPVKPSTTCAPRAYGTTVRVVPTREWVPFGGLVSARSDRTGLRLSLESELAGGETDPEPMTPGAIQIPPDGQPIILGPDGPVTGGYRVIGVVARADRGILAQARPGTRLSFVPMSSADARRAWEDALPWSAT